MNRRRTIRLRVGPPDLINFNGRNVQFQFVALFFDGNKQCGELLIESPDCLSELFADPQVSRFLAGEVDNFGGAEWIGPDGTVYTAAPVLARPPKPQANYEHDIMIREWA